MTDHEDVIAALVADGKEVDGMVADLTADQWALPTPAPGWTIAHQVAHLAATFRLAALAASDAERFKLVISTLSDDFNGNVDRQLAGYLAEPTDRLLERWRGDLDASIKALSAVPPNETVPWLVRPLPPSILAAAGMMELFGHGQDIADALGIQRVWTDRLHYLVAFAVRVWDFGYQARGMAVPDVQFRFEITAPSGGLWTFGPANADQVISGPAADFCQLVVRRRHRDDLAVKAVGAEADEWLTIAQAYRGPAGEGRRPGQFAPVRG